MTALSVAQELAAKTPETRNRAVDFFRAVAIILVVMGHWLVAAPIYVDGHLESAKILTVQPWTQFLTWLFQVMPVFFVVGGYSNAASWTSACRDEEKRRAWPANRARRLLIPTLPLVIFWILIAAVTRRTDLDPELIRLATRGGLVPVWFLAVYVFVSILVPVSDRVWKRFGLLSIIMFVIAAALVDLAVFSTGLKWLQLANYGFIWLAIHQLGYWWYRGDFGILGPLLLLAFGATSLVVLVGYLGYPISMVSVPGAEISNSNPPSFAMLSIGFVEAGIMLLIAGPVSKLLLRPRIWMLVILANYRIMTVYLWHGTALVAIFGIAILFDGFGLKLSPGSPAWWLSRPIWIGVLVVTIGPFFILFGRFEANSRLAKSSTPDPGWVFTGATMACIGLALLALQGSSANNVLGVNVLPSLAAIIGVSIATKMWRVVQG